MWWRLTAAPTAALVLLSGCAPSLSTFQPAHVAPVHTVTVSAGGELGVPTGALDTLLDTGKTLAQRGESGQTLTGQEQLTILDAGINLLLAAPTAAYLGSIHRRGESPSVRQSHNQPG